MSSITRRWLRGSLLVTLLLVALAEGLFIYATYSSYYNGVRQAILSRISITSAIIHYKIEHLLKILVHICCQCIRRSVPHHKLFLSTLVIMSSEELIYKLIPLITGQIRQINPVIIAV